MKLLLDQNLSPSLADKLAVPFPGSAHVHTHGLDSTPDALLWDFARENGFVIVTKDVDFSDRSALLGHPPKIVWLRLGNCSTSDIESVLRSSQERLQAFDRNPDLGVLVLLG